MTPQQIDDARTRAEIDRHVARGFSAKFLARAEKNALRQHPPGQRRTVPVPEAIRNLAAQLARAKRQPKIKQHVLP